MLLAAMGWAGGEDLGTERGQISLLRILPDQRGEMLSGVQIARRARCTAEYDQMKITTGCSG